MTALVMLANQPPTFRPLGEDGLLVELEPVIRADVNARLRALAWSLEKAALPGALEIVVAYRSLAVYFDPEIVTLEALQARVLEVALHADTDMLPSPRRFRLPTVYDREHGPDLDYVASEVHLTPAEVVARFSRGAYPIYCLGFLCCLAYLGDTPPRLHLPRRATPRTRVPAGSVGIAGGQAVALPLDQPSGFHYLGRTFVTLYEPQAAPPCQFRPGDIVEFPSVTAAEAQAWAGRSLGECLVGSAADP